VVAGYLASFGLMTTRVAALLVASCAFVLWSSDAHAQKIPWIVVPLAAAPIIAVVFSIALGLMTKSWRVGLGNTGLVLVWGIWFVAASKYSDSDLMVWGAIAALGLHLLVMVSLVVQHAIRRARVRHEP
jgi:succinate dehydrogenase/fumarate reductase cytochrome b subunit